MLSNPVLKREFTTSLRTPRAIALGIAFILGLSALVILMWPAGGMYSIAAQNSRQLFIILSMGFLTLVVLCAPSFTSVAITSEKEQDTYEMLYDTMLTPWDIISGKLAAGVGYVMILILCSLPMMGACLILGGVSETDVLKVYLIVTLSGLFFGLLGLYCSAIFRSSYRALILCYIFILSLCGGVWIPSVILGTRIDFVHYLHLFRSLSPFAAMTSVVYPGFFSEEHPTAPGALGEFADGMTGFIVVSIIGGITLFLLVMHRVAKPPQSKSKRSDDIIEDRMDLIKRHVSFPFYLIDPRKRKRMIGSLLNVIFVKEMRAKAFSRATWIIRLMATCFIFSLLLAFAPLWQSDVVGFATIAFTCISLPLAIVILMSPVLTASGITEERENGIFDMLRCTRVSAWTLIMGKMQVAWFFTLLMLASTFPTFFVLTYISSDTTDMDKISSGINKIVPPTFDFAGGWNDLSQVNSDFVIGMGCAFLVVVVAMLFATIVGITASSFSQRSSTSTAISYGVVLGWALGTLIPYFIAGNIPDWIVRASLTMNPFAAAAKAVRDEVFPTYPASMWLHNIMIVGGISAALLIISIVRVSRMMKPQK